MHYPKFWNYRSTTSTLLLPFSLIYFLISKLRHFYAKPIRLPAKVICVGNVSVGGTGKTQVVKWLATKLLNKNIKVAIICKGYKSQTKESLIVQDYHSAHFVGDEAKYLSQTTTAIVAKNIADIVSLVQKIRPDVIILDDFLQNPYITKDASILVIDSDRMFGNNRLIPAGPLRQNFASAMQKATLSIALGSKENHTITGENQEFFAQITCSQKFDLNQKYIAFAGIGNHERFFACLKLSGLDIQKELKFPDHHNYQSQDIDMLRSMAHELQGILITTPKDAIKLQNRLNFLVFEPELKFSNHHEEKAFELIYDEIKKN
jgi:tetraacyldisaccharide 4'-kinase